MTSNIQVILEKTSTGYSAYSPEIGGVIATGENITDVKKEYTEALEFHLEGLREFNEEIPEILQGEYNLEFKVDIQELFNWLGGVLTQTGVAKISDINTNLLSQYANGLKKPGPKQLKKIETSLHAFGKDLQQLSL